MKSLGAESEGERMNELLLHKAQKGDPQAFETLMTPFEQMVWRVCWHYLGRREDAEDAAQEVMLKAWRGIGGFRGECSVETWLYRICAGVCTDALRKRKLRDSVSMDAMHESGNEWTDNAPLPEETVAEEEHRADVRAALDALPDDMRIALLLSAVEGRSYEEVARITGVPMGTVKSRIGRAREKLIKMLEKREQSGVPSVQQHERRANK